MLLSGGGERPRKPEDLIDSRLMARLDRIDLRTRRIFAGRIQGERRSKTRGQSVEFEDFREYVEGDDLRFIDWNVYARLDRLIIKIFLEEEDLALHLVDGPGRLHGPPRRRSRSRPYAGAHGRPAGSE